MQGTDLTHGRFTGSAPKALLASGGVVDVGELGTMGGGRNGGGAVRQRAFPGWATIPSTYSLADARLWHLAFAWVLGPALVLYLLPQGQIQFT